MLMRKLFSVLGMMLFPGQGLYAQVKTVTGKVVSSLDNKPVPGATVTVDGGKRRNSAVAGADGSFSISVPGGIEFMLEVSAVGYGTSPNSFCRYFKSRTRKTYSRFLIEVRVGHACKLLIENNLSIKQLCYESGFNNFTSFYKYFKLITGKSPLGYHRSIKQSTICS